MILIKLAILISGSLYAGILPYTLWKSIKHIEYDPSKQTLSYLSIRDMYGDKFRKGYSWLLFSAAALTYIFFVLLSEFYCLGEYDRFIEYINYCSFYFVVLAFIPLNLYPYKKENVKHNIRRILHNVFAALVFVTLAALVVLFHIATYEEHPVFGLIGLLIIGLTVAVMIWSIIKNSLNGFSELIFINGIGIWSIFVTVMTMLL
ncbi:MAG: hypothetical protein LBH80_07405 [Prevotellaceae bacterium]|jgi:hypothetical protein|nr:hypothetical protein [Prevotellaceae bacterium]